MEYVKTLMSPLAIQVEITDACPERCIYCYNSRKVKYNHQNSLSISAIDIIVNDIQKYKINKVTITGGEPLTAKNTLFYFLQKLNNINVRVAINTNLMLLDNNFAQQLQNYEIDSLLCSLSSYNKTTHNFISGCNSFDRVIDGIKNAINIGLTPAISMVLTKYNINDIFETAKFAKDLGVKSFNVTKGSYPLGEKGFEKISISQQELIFSLNEMLRVESELGLKVDILECYPLCLLAEDPRFIKFSNHSCTAGITTCTIGANGNIRPCSHSDVEYGSINEGLTNVWERMQALREGKLLPNECRACKYIFLCTGGCRIEAKGYGSITGLDPYACLENIDKINDMLATREEVNTLSSTAKLQFNSNIKIREEQNFTILFLYNSSLLVTKDTINLMKEFNNQFFTIQQLCTKFNYPLEKMIKFISVLYKKHYIISAV